MEERNAQAEFATHKLNVEEVAKTFKLSMEAADKVVTLMDNMGLTLDEIKTMSLEELQIRHGAYLLEKSQTEEDVERWLKRTTNTLDADLTKRQEDLMAKWRRDNPGRARREQSKHTAELVEEGKKDGAKWRKLQEDLDIMQAQAERQKKQEEMEHVRNTVPGAYANRKARRRILRENAKKNKRKN